MKVQAFQLESVGQAAWAAFQGVTMLSAVSYYAGDANVGAELALHSAQAYVAAIRGYTASSIRLALQRRRQAHVGSLFAACDPFHLSLAKSADDLRAATELVQRQYAARGYFADTEHAASRSMNEPRLEVIVARRHGATVGTMSVGIDSPTGLYADEINRDFVDRLRAGGQRLGEVVRLAVSHQPDTDSRKTLAALFNAAHGVTVAQRLDALLIEVHPRHAGFYRRALCFEVAGEARLCPRVNAPSVLLKMAAVDLTHKIVSLERALAQCALDDIY